MKKFRKKPIVIEAVQWFKHGDHPEDGPALQEGKIVRFFRRPDILGDSACISEIPCGHRMQEHGWIDTPEGGHIVCPGDWIITGIKGERYPCKPSIFSQTYDPVE